jgi:hypothetical protein
MITRGCCTVQHIDTAWHASTQCDQPQSLCVHVIRTLQFQQDRVHIDAAATAAAAAANSP